MNFKSLSATTASIIAALANRNNHVAAEERDCYSNPDPHFGTWDGTPYDYHGGCKLVLVHVPDFLDIHIETVPTSGYSFIDKVGLRVMDETFTLDASTGAGIPGTLGGYPFTYATYYGSDSWELSLDGGQFVRFMAWSGSMSVQVRGSDADFSSAVGMCGTWDTPGLIDRDGMPLANGNEMGLEWAVIDPDDEPIIGSSVDGCDDPIPFGFGGVGQCDKEQKCLCDATVNPDGKGGCPCFVEEGRCLCEDDTCVTEDAVEHACKNVNDPDQQENCKFDVATTGDVAFGEAPFYQEPEPPLSDSFCEDSPLPKKSKGKPMHGKNGQCEEMHEDAVCVFKCIETEEFRCLPGLCKESDGAPDKDGKAQNDRCACQVPK